MPTLHVQIKNLDQVRNVFKSAPAKMTKELHTAVGRTIQTIQSNAMREAPVNKRGGGGNLRQSIKSQMTGTATGVVHVDAAYARYVQTDDGKGTRPHQIRARNKRVLADKRAGQIFGRTVNHPGTKDNPFLTRGVEKSSDSINQFFTDAVNNVFK